MSSNWWCYFKFQANIFPNIDDKTKAKILQVDDPAEDIKTLDTDTVEKLVRNNPIMMISKEAKTDEVSKIFRIFSDNISKICGEEDLYDTTETGLYHTSSLLNHAFVPNTTTSWVMGDFQRHQKQKLIFS